jgi:hypothetical protein
MSNVLQRRPLDDLGFRQLIADNVDVFVNRVKVMSCQYERERVSRPMPLRAPGRRR